jgi:hypothetical protein
MSPPTSNKAKILAQSATKEAKKEIAAPSSATKKQPDESSTTNEALKKVKKTVVFGDETKNKTTVFNKDNPVTHMTSFVDVDFTEEEKEEKKRLLIHRQKHTADSVQDATVKTGVQQQAFHPLSIPFVVDTDNLTVAELRAELEARNLPTRGSRHHLVKRLDAYLKEFEGHRMEKAVQDEKKLLQSLTIGLKKKK